MGLSKEVGKLLDSAGRAGELVPHVKATKEAMNLVRIVGP